jgi:hypothetical protein
MKISDIFYCEKNNFIDDCLMISFYDNDDIRIDMDIIINEIESRLKSDENWKDNPAEFCYLIDDNFDFYRNPDDTIDVRITNLSERAYHVTLSVDRLINKKACQML